MPFHDARGALHRADGLLVQAGRGVWQQGFPGVLLRRIQRFMAQLVLDFDVVAEYLRSRISLDGPYTLTMDRTNWKLGELNINALVLGIAYDHMSFPILFRLLPKRGNSNHKERIDIMQRFIRLFGRGSIKYLVADREFVGHEWFKWLNDNAVQYHLRIRDNFRVEDPRKPFLLTRKDGPLKRCPRDGPYRSYRTTLRGYHYSLHLADRVGIAANIKVKAIRVLNNGRRAISTVKYGLNFIADIIFSPFRPTKINVFEFLSCT